MLQKDDLLMRNWQSLPLCKKKPFVYYAAQRSITVIIVYNTSDVNKKTKLQSECDCVNPSQTCGFESGARDAPAQS